MKRPILLFLMAFGVSSCGGGSGSSPAACIMTSACTTQCGQTGYSNDSGTNCYSNSTCTATCTEPQTQRLRVTNNCAYTIWLQQDNMSSAGIPTIIQMTSGAHYDFAIPAAGLPSTRIWPKSGCDSTGENCTVGQSSDPCPTGQVGCPPPVDSKVEATWGCTLSDQTQCATTSQGQKVADTYWNMSAVDGYTLPFTATVTGDTIGDGSCVNADCSALSLRDCPTADDLSQGRVSTYSQYSAADLFVLNASSSQIGCFSPCKWFNYPTFGGQGLNEDSDAAIMYCCPTPIADPTACAASPSTCVTSAQCQAGPGARTAYVNLIHTKCNNTVYSYAYDDADGLRHCSASAQVSVTFCP